ncbi:acyl-CoA thioesterase [Phenylobacterium sp.]|uniref:acyl-CoA thioesterase n=1 Tax=Phenylobacterium sp. TaxID=1871053 RepID=UPI0035AE538E
MSPRTLIEKLSLERLEVNLFRGFTPGGEGRRRIYGGQVIAQSLLAAFETVEDRLCHSLHCYFIRPGDPSIPIIFEVDRARDGGSFTTRRVIAVQKGRQIFNLACSFQAAEEGFEHQRPMPEAPGWDQTPIDEDDDPDVEPLEIRRAGGHVARGGPPLEPRQQVWMRARDRLPADQKIHQVVLAYASDMTLLGTSLRPHGVHWDELQSASLDHAMWFHRPIDANAWHLFDQESPSASGGRGMNFGYLYGPGGVLVATCAQEGLMRRLKSPG